MVKSSYIFRKIKGIDKDRFADLLLAAKGERTMQEFAKACNVNPSTFTRIMQKTNKGASSPELLEAIAQNAASESGVSIDALAEANGYDLSQDTNIKALKLQTHIENTEILIRNVLVQALVSRGEEVRMGNIRYNFSKSLALSPDALIMTNAFGRNNEVWFVDSILATPRIAHDTNHPINKSRAKQIAFDKFSRFVFISMNTVRLFRPSRFSLVVLDPEVFDIIVDEFGDTNVPTDISVILIDTLNNRLVNEYMLPHVTEGHRSSYFMTTKKCIDNQEYLGSNTNIDE